MNSYPIVVYYTPEDGGYFSVVPDLPGCTAHGEPPEEALREALVAQELWVETARDLGRPIPEPSQPHALRATG